MQIGLVVVNRVNQPSDLILVEVNLHALACCLFRQCRCGPPPSSTGLFIGNCRTAMKASSLGLLFIRLMTAGAFESRYSAARTGYSAISRMTRQGLHAANTPSGTSRVTTLPAP